MMRTSVSGKMMLLPVQGKACIGNTIGVAPDHNTLIGVGIVKLRPIKATNNVCSAAVSVRDPKLLDRSTKIQHAKPKRFATKRIACDRTTICNKPEQLFDCDIFVFVASRGIPPVGSQVKDVRMAQFELNAAIVKQYARMARKAGFKGQWCAVSDPVDPLAKTAYLESNKDENGVWDGKGLRPEQVQGFGLGVMNARAAYYAKRDDRFASFLTEGRSFGPHGTGLTIANSIEHYDDALSQELTHLTVTANLKMREIGFKPYVAPALSSGALSILLTLRGEWHCGSVFLDGIYMGVKNRYTPAGIETELLPHIPDALYGHIVDAAEHLKEVL